MRHDPRMRAFWRRTRGPEGIRGSLWRPLAVFRLLAIAYAAGLAVHRGGKYVHPGLAALLLVLMAVWSLAMPLAQPAADRAGRRGPLWALAVLDVGTGAAAVLLTRAVESSRAIDNGAPTLPGLWAAGGVFALALVGGTLGGLAGATVVGAATLLERGEITGSTVGSVVLVVVAGTVVGYLVGTADAAEDALRRALGAQAAAAERERLAREVHDGALQALALLARDATRGMPPEQVAQLAHEQEAALRQLLSAGPEVGAEVGPEVRPEVGATDLGTLTDRVLAELLPPSRVSYSRPAGPVPLPQAAARETAAALRAVLDNVIRHAGADASVFVLLEGDADAVRLTVRDDGAGMPSGRPDEAAAEGRLGLARSIRGRIADLGGTVTVTSAPGEGTEVELHVPR